MAVFLKILDDRWEEMGRPADLRVDLIDETERFFDLLPFPADVYEERTSLMGDIRGQGRTL